MFLSQLKETSLREHLAGPYHTVNVSKHSIVKLVNRVNKKLNVIKDKKVKYITLGFKNFVKTLSSEKTVSSLRFAITPEVPVHLFPVKTLYLMPLTRL